MRSRMRARWALATVCAGIMLAGCGGGGGGGDAGDGSGSNSGGTGSTGSTGSTTNVLFATDYTHGGIATFDSLTPTGQDWGAHVVMTTPGGGQAIAYDSARDELYVLVDWLGQPPVLRVDVYAHASTMRAGATAARSIALSNFIDATTLALDTAHDRLWVAGMRTSYANDGAEIDVFEHASTLGGTPPADRRIQNIESIQAMALDATRSILYTVGGITNGAAYAYTGTDTLASGAKPAYTLTGAGSYGISLDVARDILYLPDVFTGLTIVHGASTGAAATSINVPFASAGWQLNTAAVDSAHDRLYLGAYNQAYVIDNASTLTSAATLPAPAASAPATVATGDYPVSIWSFAFP